MTLLYSLLINSLPHKSLQPACLLLGQGTLCCVCTTVHSVFAGLSDDQIGRASVRCLTAEDLSLCRYIVSMGPQSKQAESIVMLQAV